MINMLRHNLKNKFTFTAKNSFKNLFQQKSHNKFNNYINFGNNFISKNFTTTFSNKKIYKSQPEIESLDKNTQDSLSEYLSELTDFNIDFKQVNPMQEDKTISEVSNEDEILRKLSLRLNTQKVREKGSAYLINTLLEIYKKIIGKNSLTMGKDSSLENYLQHINTKIDKKIRNRIKEVFSKNEIIDSINLIMKHLNDLKSSEIEKFINILIKINYSNFENWKKILRQYILYISLLETNYQPLRNKDVVQILNHLKSMYDFLPYTSDKEIQNLLERSIKESIQCILKNFDKIEVKQISQTISSISKMGFLDEEMCRKIENYLIILIKKNELSEEEFCNILFCIHKSKCASENLMKILEKHSEKIIDYYLKYPEQIDKFSVTLMCKSFYYGYRNDKKEEMTLFKKIEDLFMKNVKIFEIHQIINIAHSLVYLDKPSTEFLIKFEEILINYKDSNKLTEFLVFQILNVLMRKSEFSLENVKKYVNLYKTFIEKNQVKQRQIDVLKVIVNMKIRKGKNSEEMLNYLNQIKTEFGEYDLSQRRFDKF